MKGRKLLQKIKARRTIIKLDTSQKLDHKKEQAATGKHTFSELIFIRLAYTDKERRFGQKVGRDNFAWDSENF